MHSFKLHFGLSLTEVEKNLINIKPNFSLIIINLKYFTMKKRNLNKLSLNKNVISNLQKKSVQGGHQDNLPSIKYEDVPIECESSVNHLECVLACH